MVAGVAHAGNAEEWVAFACSVVVLDLVAGLAFGEIVWRGIPGRGLKMPASVKFDEEPAINVGLHRKVVVEKMASERIATVVE